MYTAMVLNRYWAERVSCTFYSDFKRRDGPQDICRRVGAYLEGGASEVIVVGRCGEVEVWGVKGQRQASMFGIALSLDRTYFEEGGVAAAPSARC
ncbi:hypothetical protein OKW41_006205 [Paraburkholderia sp. UCT70]